MNMNTDMARPLETAYVQGIGKRPEQQDSFRFSVAADYRENGFTAILCDGMGGMAAGARISKMAADSLYDIMSGKTEPTVENRGMTLTASQRIAGEITNLSNKIYRQFYGRGGTTLVMTYIVCGKVFFWCVGDSDLILVREGRVCFLNERHEYRNELLKKAAYGLVTEERAFMDPQADALTEYIGKEDVWVEYNRRAFSLKAGDSLLLCSDGITDTLPDELIGEILRTGPEAAAALLEENILKADIPTQDNYTGMIIRYNGD